MYTSRACLCLLAVACGVVNCGVCTDQQRAWLADTISRGLADRQFQDSFSSVSAMCAARLVQLEGAQLPETEAVSPETLQTSELVLAAGFSLAFGAAFQMDSADIEEALFARLLRERLVVGDVAEAATLKIVVNRYIDHISLRAGAAANSVDVIERLCRRFHFL